MISTACGEASSPSVAARAAVARARRLAEGALAIFLLVFLSTFPVVIPFMILTRCSSRCARRTLVAIVMLFGVGFMLAAPWRLSAVLTGASMVLLGVVAASSRSPIALGG